jgi:mono/diheme cytochrome c family protein
MHNCFACHGNNGDDGKGPRIAGLSMSYGRFLKRLRHAETAIMPEYPQEKISDQDAADILAWLKSLK